MVPQKRIAIVFASSIYDQKGLFNAVHNRVKYLIKIAEFQIDAYLLSTYKGKVISVLCGEESNERPSIYQKDGVVYHLLWRKNSVIDFLLYHKLHYKEIFHQLYDRKIAALFKGYDLLDVHSGAGNLALEVKHQYNIPYIITWHGSDIHTSPFNSLSQKIKTKALLENASCNCFVSNGLKEVATKIVASFRYEILYNGANESFFKYDIKEREIIQRKYNPRGKKIVAFIGNVIEVKNPLSLPVIFDYVRKNYKKDVQFWIIGDGELKPNLEEQLRSSDLDYIAWGNQPIDKIPVLLQTIDVVVLPSHREGFGMVLVEAIKCGVNAVASKVDGTVEILGEEDTFSLNDTFAEKIATRIVYYLDNNIEQKLDSCFSWENTAKLENKIIEGVLFK